MRFLATACRSVLTQADKSLEHFPTWRYVHDICDMLSTMLRKRIRRSSQRLKQSVDSGRTETMNRQDAPARAGDDLTML